MLNDDLGTYVWSAGRSTGLPSNFSSESALKTVFARTDDCLGACLGWYVVCGPAAGDLGGEVLVSKILDEGLRCVDGVIVSDVTLALPLASDSESESNDAPTGICELGVPGLEIQIPSTSIPLWIARTPNGISGRFRTGMPAF